MAKQILSVSELNKKNKRLLESSLGVIWVEGEVSNFSRPASGHWYFTLKDQHAQIRCAMFKQANLSLRFIPENGMMLTLKARVTIYEPSGTYQLICQYAELGGDGKILRDYEELKNKLETEGLFNPDFKKPLPAFPETIGIISSATGAALQDILQVIKRRAPTINVLVYSSSVQGQQALGELIKGIQYLSKQNHVECIVLARGGGSLEDLNVFNQEALAREIYHCGTPVISAIGHETDFTICDFVADVRAATPSVAGELISPDQQQWQAWLEGVQVKLEQLIFKNISHKKQHIQILRNQIQHPKSQLQTMQQQLDDYAQRLIISIKHYLNNKNQQLEIKNLQLQQFQPENKIKQLQQNNAHYQYLLFEKIQKLLKERKNLLTQQVSNLNLLSPLNTLSRGYALVTDNDSNKVLSSITQVNTDSLVNIQLSDGSFKARIQ